VTERLALRYTLASGRKSRRACLRCELGYELSRLARLGAHGIEVRELRPGVDWAPAPSQLGLRLEPRYGRLTR